MPNNTISKTKATNSKPTKKFLRLPIDAKTESLIQDIISENPFFTPLDAIRYVLGRFIIQNNQNSKTKLIKLFDELKQKHLNTIELNEDEIFKILEKNNLM